MKAGIYLFTNTINNKYYVGKSTHLEGRHKTHLVDLRGGYHDNKHLQAAWNRYGEAAFIHAVVEYCEGNSPEELEALLVRREDWWMALLDSRNSAKGYNKRSSQFLLHSDETKEKMAAAQRGKPKSPQHRAKIAERNRAMALTPVSEKTRARISAANKGRKQSPEVLEAMASSRRGNPNPDIATLAARAANTGRRLSPEHRAKIAAGNRGRPKSPEQVAKMTGVKHTAEARAKMSAAKKGRPSPHKGRSGKPWSEERRAVSRAYWSSRSQASSEVAPL